MTYLIRELIVVGSVSTHQDKGTDETGDVNTHFFVYLFELKVRLLQDRDSRGERSNDAQPINVTPLARDVTESGFNS